jgi:hypothetical protein
MSASVTLPERVGRGLRGVEEEGMVILVPQTLFQCNGWCLQRATGLASSAAFFRRLACGAKSRLRFVA